MNRKVFWAGVVVLALGLAHSQPAAGAAEQQRPGYTMAEYNAYQACVAEQNVQQRVKCLDDFVGKFPQSELLPYVYTMHYNADKQLQNYPKVIEYTDKLLLGFREKLEIGSKVDALYNRALVFEYAYNARDANAKEQLTRAVETAREGITALEQWTTPPQNVSQEQFDQAKKTLYIQFYNTLGFAQLQLREFPGAIDAYKQSLSRDPSQALVMYRVGLANLQREPASHMDGFWALARSISLKVPNEPQVRAYLRNQVYRYQATTCEPLLDRQVNELLALAGGSAERPANYRIPSSTDLEKARENAGAFLEDLKAGGDHAKVVWLAVCGLEFPDVAVKVLAVEEGNDSVILKVFRAPTAEEMEAGTEPNFSIKVAGQPEAKRLSKDDFILFTGTLMEFQPEPFLLSWEKAAVNPEYIPEEKGEPSKKATKRPGKRPPAR